MKYAIAILTLGALVGCTPGETLSVSIYTDPMTGCQYLHRLNGGITPRLNPDGTQFCTRKEQSND